MSDIKEMVALTALNNMMAKGHFDICCVQSVGDLLGINPRGTEAYRMLHPLHCVDWNKMPPELREAVPGLIQQCLGIGPQYQFKTVTPQVIDVTTTRPEQPKRGGFMRLLGGGK